MDDCSIRRGDHAAERHRTGTFTLEVYLDNDAMQTTDDVAWALRRVAEKLETGVCCSAVRDENGNTVGQFHLHREG